MIKFFIAIFVILVFLDMIITVLGLITVWVLEMLVNLLSFCLCYL